MSSKITIATIQDVRGLTSLVNSAYRGESSRAGWTTEADFLGGTRIDESSMEKIIRSPGCKILKYQLNEDLLGCMELRKDGQKLYLGMLTVRPHLQGKGIGKELLKSAEEEAVRQKCDSIYMSVISVRKELIEWYVRHGYRDTGARKPFVIEDPSMGEPRMKLEFVMLEKLI